MNLRINKYKAKIRSLIGYPFLRDVTHNKHIAHKKVLLIYRVKPFLLKSDDPQLYHHQNMRQSLQIAVLLAEKGYTVDVLDVQNRIGRFDAKKYDVVISHRVDFEATFSSHAKKIYLATGLNHVIHNRKVKERYEYLNERKGCALEIERLLPESMPFVASADYIFSFGNEYVRETWQSTFPIPILSFNNYGAPFDFENEIIDYQQKRKNFLFFASEHQVGKGLDIALDTFSQLPDLNLYICSSFQVEDKFCKCYFRELSQLPNIHPVGWVSIASKEFKELCHKCGYLIYPSCSDACPGAVMVCMQAGLIPIILPQSGIDFDDFVVPLDSFRLDDIKRVILDVVNRDENWYQNSLSHMKLGVTEKYSEKSFLSRWKQMLTEVLGE